MSDFAGSSGYFRINTSQVPQIATPIGFEQLSDMAADQKLRDAMTALYSKNCALVSALEVGEIFIAPPGGTLVYEAVLIPGYADGGQRLPINCQTLNLKAVTPMGKIGAWGLDANGGPQWNVSDPPTVPPIGQPGTGWSIPAAKTATDVMRYLWEKFEQGGLGGPSPSYQTKP